MAYNYYSSGYDQEDLSSYYHYDNNQSYSNYYDNDNQSYTDCYPSYAYQTYEPMRYVQDYDTQFHGNAFQLAPSQSIVGYYYHSAYDQHEYPADKDAKYDDLATTGYIVSLSNAELQGDLDFEEYNPEPFHGGYDVKETYGEPLPPSNEICYPPSKIQPLAPLEPSNFSSIPSPYGQEDKKPESVAMLKDVSLVGNLAEEEQVPSDFEEDDDGEYDEEEEEEYDDEEEVDDQEVGDIDEPEEEEQQGGVGIVVYDHKQPSDFEGHKDEDEVEEEEEEQQGEAGIVVYDHKQPSDSEGDEEEDEVEEEEEEENRENFDDKGAEETQIRRQIPPGYGLEAMDLCEGVFGGYFPCLSKRKQERHDQKCDCKCHHKEINYYSYEDCWSKTADYLFGNPNPYGGSMPEKGSYGDPVYSYQRYSPQKSLTQHIDEYGGDYELLQSSRYAYGYNQGVQDYYHV